MINELPFVITISRQLGSGGAYLGHRLATRLNILYLDREIVFQAANELKISETELDSRDEKVTPRWRQMLDSMACGVAMMYTPPSLDIPSDETLYSSESEIIARAAEQHSAVIVGRAGFKVLRQQSRHLSVFLCADIAFRMQRVQELDHISELDTQKLINRIDRERAQYLKVFTGQDGTNACQYHLCLDTGVLGFDTSEDIILAALKARLGHNGS